MTKSSHQAEDSKIPRATFSQILELLSATYIEHRWRLFAGFSALLIVDLLQLTIPRIIKHGIDRLESGDISGTELLHLGGWVLVIALFVIVLRFTWRYLIIGFSRLLERNIRNKIFSHILKMDAPFFEKRTTGDLMAHSSNDLSAVQMACGMGMVAAVDSAVMLIAAIGFMIAIHPLLTLLALLPMPILAVSTRILASKLHKRFSAVQSQFSLLTEFSRSTLVSIGLIKAYTMEDFQTNQFDILGRKYVKANLRVATIHGLISPIATLVGNLGMLVVLFWGGKLVIEGSITLGDFVAFLTYLYMLIWPVMAIGWVTSLVQRGTTSLGRIYDLVSSESLVPNPLTGPEPNPKTPGFKISNLTFTYPSGTSPALDDISLDFGPGIHGITGRTGSGKSTLCKLLSRIYPIADSQLYLSGNDVNLLPLAQVRSQIGYVGQEPVLFSTTIAQNIALGLPEASMEEIESAAKNAAIHKDILTFEDGYQTMIGERGIKLSGGQRQRLALARALLCNRDILLIDDGLSAVDVTTEQEVFDGLKRYFKGKTVIIVSNRTKLLSMTDRIIVFKDGKVENDAPHSQLLRENDLYLTMFKKQMQNSVVEERGEI